MRSREIITRLEREGWTRRPGKGSHLVFRRDTQTLVVSQHAGDVPSGTLRAICRQAGWEYPPRR